jgi:2,4-dienoyl-CoA reductase (NADPH2)
MMQQHTVHTPYMVGEAHFYSTEIAGEMVLFDTGPATPEAQAYLQSRIDLSRLKHLFITHCHVDHYGLARFIEENSDAEIYIPRKDARKLAHHEKRLAHIEAELEELGFGRDYVRRFRETVERNRIFPGAPARFQVVEESSAPARLGIEILGCPGHSQSDLVYLVGESAVTGDILLRGIFQAPLLDVDLDTFAGRFRNYQAYCASLRRLAGLRGRQILPGHRFTVESLDEAILFYVGKLCERAERLKGFATDLPLPVLLGRLFGEALSDPFVAYLKASEIVFMRDFLAEPKRLKESLAAIGLLDRSEFIRAAVA